MLMSKLIRWAGVSAVALVIPAAAMASHHRHTPLTRPTTAPSAKLVKVSHLTSAKRAGAKPAAVKKTVHHALTHKKHTAAKLHTIKKSASKLTAKKHAASMLASKPTKASSLASHKAVPNNAVVTKPAAIQ